MRSGPLLPPLDVDLTVSIVTWNSRADILACLGSLAAAAGSLTWRATVVDNASTDGTADAVASAFPGAHLVRNRANVGFGAAHNAAMRSGVGRRHLVLNPDTVLLPRSLEILSDFLDHRPDVGFVGPRVLDKNGSIYPSCRAFPTPGALLFRNKLLAGLFPDNPYTREYLMGGSSHDSPLAAGWISGSAIMASREALNDVGLLDERFFMYCEDMDWCRRAHDCGWEVFYEPAAVIVHLRARSTDQRIPAMILEHHRSMWKYYDKHQRSSRPAWWSAGVAAVITARALALVAMYYLKRAPSLVLRDL